IADARTGKTLVRTDVDGHVGGGIAFSHDGKRIAAASGRGVSVWSTDGSRIWSSSRVKSRLIRPFWASGDTRLLLEDEQSSIVDSRTGELLAHFDPEARSPQPHSFASPDLRYLVKRGKTGWSVEPLPAPEDGPPAALLQRILGQTGLELAGAELTFT